MTETELAAAMVAHANDCGNNMMLYRSSSRQWPTHTTL